MSSKEDDPERLECFPAPYAAPAHGFDNGTELAMARGAQGPRTRRRLEQKEGAMKQTLILGMLLAVTACTTVDYTSQQFAAQSADHQTVAVLPFEMVLTGRVPQGMTPDQVAAIEEAESLAFQTALYYSMLDRSSARRKDPIRIRIQPVEETNRILADRGIATRETWAMPAEELAAMLGVDAVIHTTVQKTRYLSDMESYGIEVGSAIFNEITDGELGWMVPHGPAVTVGIWADSTLINGADGDVLWKVALERATDWQRPANDVIVGITRKLAKKFPYRA
jgi:hypothetical protein